MNVQELIDALQRIKDKSLAVVLNVSGVYNSGCDDAYGVVKRIDIVSRLEAQDCSDCVPVVYLSLYAEDNLEEEEIVMMRNKTLAPFASMWESDGVAAVLDKNDNVIKRYYYATDDDYTESARKERDRLNAEYRKEQNNG